MIDLLQRRGEDDMTPSEARPAEMFNPNYGFYARIMERMQEYLGKQGRKKNILTQDELLEYTRNIIIPELEKKYAALINPETRGHIADWVLVKIPEWVAGLARNLKDYDALSL